MYENNSISLRKFENYIKYVGKGTIIYLVALTKQNQSGWLETT